MSTQPCPERPIPLLSSARNPLQCSVTHSRRAASSSGLQDPLKCVLSTAIPPAAVRQQHEQEFTRQKTAAPSHIALRAKSKSDCSRQKTRLMKPCCAMDKAMCYHHQFVAAERGSPPAQEAGRKIRRIPDLLMSGVKDLCTDWSGNLLSGWMVCSIFTRETGLMRPR
jgi:hypothetical protein